MKYLKNKIVLFVLNMLPAVSSSELYRKITPYLIPFGLQMGSDLIHFPHQITLDQWIELRRNCGTRYESGIPYRDIIIVMEEDGELLLFLRTGYVFVFSFDTKFWRVTPVYAFRRKR